MGIVTVVLGAILPAVCVAWSVSRSGAPAQAILRASLLQGLLWSLPVASLLAGPERVELERQIHLVVDQLVAAAREEQGKDGAFVVIANGFEARRALAVSWGPALLPAITWVWVTTTSWLAVLYLAWSTGSQSQAEALVRYRGPSWIPWVLVGSTGALAALLRGTVPATPGLWGTLATNVVVISVFAAGLQGVAVTNWYIRRLQPGPLMRALSPWLQAFLWFTFPFTWVVSVLLGLADNWFDFRSIEEGDAPQRRASR